MKINKKKEDVSRVFYVAVVIQPIGGWAELKMLEITAYCRGAARYIADVQCKWRTDIQYYKIGKVSQLD